MAKKHGRKSLKGVKGSRHVGHRPKHSKKSADLRRKIREGKILLKKSETL